jgi:HlyD family secretion protein
MSAVGAATPWFRLARDSEIELAAQLSESDLAKLRVGQHAQVTLPGGLTVAGTVRLISPQIDPQTKLGTVRVRLPVEGDIRAGGFGRAVFTDVTGNVLAAPETAIRYDADGAAVMTVGPDNRVRRMIVQTGLRGGGWVQLIKGPPAGTRIVQNAAAFLLDGDLIKPSASDPTATRTTTAAAVAPVRAVGK